MSNGHRIIEGINDAIAGNFARVTIDGQTWVRADEPVSNETNGWQPIETCPKDGTPFLATLRIFDAQTKEFMHHDTQVVFVDEETGEVHPDCYYGWDLADCEFWMPLPHPPHNER